MTGTPTHAQAGRSTDPDTSGHDHADRFAGVNAVRDRYGRAMVDRSIAGCFTADEAADRLAGAFAQRPGRTGWALLEGALAAGPDGYADGPDELTALLRPLTSLPTRFDPDRLHAGAVAYWRAGAGPLSLSLTCGALAYGYQSASLSRPLAATGRLEHMASRRLAETARWVLAVTTPGAMLPGREGFDACVRVRVVHALVRAHLLRDTRPDHVWHVEDWGLPLSDTDCAATAMGGFLTIHLDAMHDLGVHYSRQELEDMTHLWAWIAQTMGVPAELAPTSYAQARAQSRAAVAIDAGPSTESAALMHALLHHPVPAIQALPKLVRGPATAVNAHVLAGLARRWLGDEMADRLGVERSPLVHAALLARPANVARGAVMRSGLLGRGERLGAAERAVVRRVLAQGRAPRTPIRPQDAALAPVLASAAGTAAAA